MAQLCANCGASLTDDELFCHRCGAAQPQPAAAEAPEELLPETERFDAPPAPEEPKPDEAPVNVPEAEAPVYAPAEQPPVYTPNNPPVYTPAPAFQLPVSAPAGRGGSPGRVLAVFAAVLAVFYLLMMVVLPVLRINPDSKDYQQLYRYTDGPFYGDAGSSFSKTIINGITLLDHANKYEQRFTDEDVNEMKATVAASAGILVLCVAAVAMCGVTAAVKKRLIPGIVAAVLLLGSAGAAYWFMTFLNGKADAAEYGVENMLQVSVWGFIAAGFAAVAAIFCILAVLIKDQE